MISEPIIAAPEERYVGSQLTHAVTVVFIHFRWLLQISTMLTWFLLFVVWMTLLLKAILSLEKVSRP